MLWFFHRELLFSNPSGLILSTDDYFEHGHAYSFDPDHLGAAHEWNQSRGLVSLNAFQNSSDFRQDSVPCCLRTGRIFGNEE